MSQNKGLQARASRVVRSRPGTRTHARGRGARTKDGFLIQIDPDIVFSKIVLDSTLHLFDSRMPASRSAPALTVTGLSLSRRDGLTPYGTVHMRRDMPVADLSNRFVVWTFCAGQPHPHYDGFTLPYGLRGYSG